MANQVEICNVALNFLGDLSITSIDDDTTRARLCKAFWPVVLDYVLREHPWKCAVIRYSCALLGAAPLFGFTHQYQLPDNCLRVIAFEGEEDDYAWQVEGRVVVTDYSPCHIIYVARVDDAAELDSMVTMAVAVKLAMFLAHAITDKANLVEGLENLYKKVLDGARAVNAQEGSPTAFESNVLVDVR